MTGKKKEVEFQFDWETARWKLKYGKWMIFAAIVVRLLETWYFGWNAHPESTAEWWWDFVTGVMFWSGIVAYVSPLLSMYEKIIGGSK